MGIMFNVVKTLINHKFFIDIIIYSDLIQQGYTNTLYFFLDNLSLIFQLFFVYSHITIFSFVNCVHYLPGRMPGAHCAELRPHLVVS